MFATLDPTFKNLKTALKLMNYSTNKMTLLMCVRTIYRPVVYEFMEEEGLHALFDEGTKMKYIRKEDAKEIKFE